MENDLYSPPTVYQEINFIYNIYTSREKLVAELRRHGFGLYKDVEVPSVDCFFYLPERFPVNREQAENFDFAKYRGKKITFGICVGGTTITSGWNEKISLAVKGLLKKRDTHSTADQAATNIYQALDTFLVEFPELSQEGIELEVNICGYSLGGLFGQVATVLLQDWGNTTRSRITCRTYESCGVPDTYHEVARNYTEGDVNYWKDRIENYKSFPNPLNSVFPDLGRVFHLMNLDKVIPDGVWRSKCVMASLKRVSLYLSGGLASLFRLTGLTFATMTSAQIAIVVSTFMALEFGLECAEINCTHNIDLMLTCFDEQGNQFEGMCKEMRSWPVYDDLETSVLKAIALFTRSRTLFNTKNSGIHTMIAFGGKKGFFQRKLDSFPGYQLLDS